jgi:hypothetical protein
MIFGFVHNREAIVQLAVIGDQQKKQGFVPSLIQALQEV